MSNEKTLDEQLRESMKRFCIKVMDGTNCTPEEMAAMPSVLRELLRDSKESESWAKFLASQMLKRERKNSAGNHN